jgi:molybdopterin-containing oxidoreductase family membrane subunit
MSKAAATDHSAAPHTGAPRILDREPLVLNNRSYSWITNRICGIVENKQPALWWLLFVPSVLLTGLTVFCFAYLISTGVGVWGQKQPVAWAWDITNFVFWIGIGHAGTLISAILFLTRQKWRTSVNRAAEAMTLFAVMCAGLFPAFHVGRVWMVWFLAPIPNANAIWQNFKSPLLWDVFAVSTYFTVSVIFWYIGLIPDLATLRDRCKPGLKKMLYGMFALGWRGGNRHWSHYETAYMLLAALSTPLVLSVHSVVSFDFATSVVPGWHTTIFPPYFVAGAIFSGFAMVWTIIIPMRRWFGLRHYVTLNHLDASAKMVLFTSLVVGLAYLIEFFIAWYGGVKYEQDYFWNRVFGQWWWAAWIMLTCNMILPLSLFSQKLRRNPTWLWILSIFINIGMWFERFVIVVPSLSHDVEPWQWSTYMPTWVDYALLIGSFGWFFMWFLLFVKQLPVMALAEIKEIIPPKMKHTHSHGGH